MDRSLSYKLLGDNPIPHESTARIRLAEAMMNNCFTWTSHKISLAFADPGTMSALEHDASSNLPILGSGRVVVGKDDWNACLLLRFLQWASTQMPEVRITVEDTGQDLLPSAISFAGRAIGLTFTYDDELMHPPKDKAKKADSERFRERMRKALAGQFFAEVPARDYADRPEVREILRAKPSLVDGCLEHIADELQYPWDTEWMRES